MDFFQTMAEIKPAIRIAATRVRPLRAAQCVWCCRCLESNLLCSSFRSSIMLALPSPRPNIIAILQSVESQNLLGFLTQLHNLNSRKFRVRVSQTPHTHTRHYTEPFRCTAQARVIIDQGSRNHSRQRRNDGRAGGLDADADAAGRLRDVSPSHLAAAALAGLAAGIRTQGFEVPASAEPAA